MAVNLRSKMDPTSKLLVCDVSKDAVSRFQKEVQGKGSIEVVSTGAEAAKAAVRHSRMVCIMQRETIDMKPGLDSNDAAKFVCGQANLPRSVEWNYSGRKRSIKHDAVEENQHGVWYLSDCPHLATVWSH